MKLLNISLLALTLISGACSSDDDDNSCSSLYGYCYSASGVTVSGSTVSGTGTVNFGVVADSAETGRNFKFGVTLADGASVTLKAFGQADLENAANIVFTRSGSTVSFDGGEGAKNLLTAGLVNADATGPLTINVDVHNDEDGEAHVFAWAGDTDPEQGSENLENHAEKGVGVYGGLTLSNATVTSFVVAADKVQDED